jgi:acetyl esterase/lipase
VEEPREIALWPNGAPGFESRKDDPPLAKDYWIRNIHNPSVTAYLPPKDKATGDAVVICPGGGHRELVFKAAAPIDRLSSRPDFQILIYPGPIGIPDVIPADAPPAFLLVANDDRGASRVVASLFQKYRTAGLLVEAHILAWGGHGFNMGYRSKLKSVKKWPERLADWMNDDGILDPLKKAKDRPTR